jgi:hypothetical protein
MSGSRNNRERRPKPEIAEVLQIYNIFGVPLNVIGCEPGTYVLQIASTEASKVKRSPSTDAAQSLGDTRRASMRPSPQKGRR